MSLIIKSNKVSKAKQQKQAYTWAACILIAVFAVATAIPMLSGGEDTAANYRERAYDLAQLPFTNDAAEQALLATDEYKDIPKNDLISGLYSKKEKEERKMEDALNGTPPPPDEEYKAAAVQKSKYEARAAIRQQAAAKAAAAPTRQGSLTRGSMVSGGSGSSSGITANIWRSDDKTYKSGTSVSTKERNQMLAKLGGAGRATGFTDATLKSGAAANAKDAESAASGAIDAFAKGLAAEDAKLNEELEKDAKELELNADSLASKDLSANDLKGVDDAVDKLDQQKQTNDQAEIKAFDWAQLALTVLNGVKDIALAQVNKAPVTKSTSTWTNNGTTYTHTLYEGGKSTITGSNPNGTSFTNNYSKGENISNILSGYGQPKNP